VEACISRGTATCNPPTRVVTLQTDLSTLPLWFEPLSCETGIVLVSSEKPTVAPSQRSAFLSYIASLPISAPSPSFISYPRSNKLRIPLPTTRTSALPLQPWGWSPHSAELYSRLSCDARPWYTGDPSQKRLFGKHFAASVLAKVLATNLHPPNGGSNPLLPEQNAQSSAYKSGSPNGGSNPLLPDTAQSSAYQSGIACTTLDQVCDAIETLQRTHPASQLGIVIKDAFEGSGRGFIHVKQWKLQADESGGVPREQRLMRPEQLNAVKKILKRTPVVVERWLTLATEFSAHYQVASTVGGATSVQFRGLLRFSANNLGKWLGSHARDGCQNMDAGVRAALFGDAGGDCDAGTPLPELSPEMRDAYERVRIALEGSLKDTGYYGPLSVDAIMYWTEEATPKLQLKPVRLSERSGRDANESPSR
jgi:hypothetical protein